MLDSPFHTGQATLQLAAGVESPHGDRGSVKGEGVREVTGEEAAMKDTDRHSPPLPSPEPEAVASLRWSKARVWTIHNFRFLPVPAGVWTLHFTP